MALPLCSHNTLYYRGPEMNSVALKWSKGLSPASSNYEVLDGKNHVLFTDDSGPGTGHRRWGTLGKTVLNN